MPFMRPRCCFLYLTFFGINMSVSLPFSIRFFTRSAGLPA
jgi:hypothetical protein